MLVSARTRLTLHHCGCRPPLERRDSRPSMPALDVPRSRLRWQLRGASIGPDSSVCHQVRLTSRGRTTMAPLQSPKLAPPPPFDHLQTSQELHSSLLILSWFALFIAKFVFAFFFFIILKQAEMRGPVCHRCCGEHSREGGLLLRPLLLRIFVLISV